MSDAKPVFRTKRFDVFYMFINRERLIGYGRHVYTAWHHSEDVPRSVCEITLMGNYVEWIHVCETMRRQGIATEVLAGLEDKVGELSMEGVTASGEAFVDAITKGDVMPQTETTEGKPMKLPRKPEGMYSDLIGVIEYAIIHIEEYSPKSAGRTAFVSMLRNTISDADADIGPMLSEMKRVARVAREGGREVSKKKTVFRRFIENELSAISEECYASGWMPGVEHTLWRSIKNIDGDYGRGLGDIGIETVQDLKTASEAIGEWFDGDKFLPIAEWEKVYDETKTWGQEK